MVQKVPRGLWDQILVLPCNNWKIVFVNPTVNGYLFELGKAKAAKGEGWAPPFISCARDAVDLLPPLPLPLLPPLPFEAQV